MTQQAVDDDRLKVDEASVSIVIVIVVVIVVIVVVYSCIVSPVVIVRGERGEV